MTMLKREMGYTRVEFMRTLPSALHDYEYTVEGDVVTIIAPEAAGKTMTIRLGSEAIRAIAMIRIPYIHVDFDFSQVEEAVHKRFLAQFDLYFKKGGG